MKTIVAVALLALGQASASERCDDIARKTAIACVNGYRTSGGNVNPTSPEYAQAGAICGKAYDIAQDVCKKHSVPSEGCAAEADFIESTIQGACPAGNNGCHRWAIIGASIYARKCQTSPRTGPESPPEIPRPLPKTLPGRPRPSPDRSAPPSAPKPQPNSLPSFQGRF